MKRISRLDYAYAVGRVRALENRLIHRSAFMEAAEEEDFSSAFRVLLDAGDFQEKGSDIQTENELEEFLSREWEYQLFLVKELFLENTLLDILSKRNIPEEAVVLAEAVGQDFIRDYFRRKIDLGNLKVFMRARYLELSLDRIQHQLLPGGTLEPREWMSRFDLSKEDFGAGLQASDYYRVWSVGLDALQTEETFSVLEREIGNLLMRYLQRARWIVFGPEPVFAYAQAKAREIELLRLVLLGKLNHLPQRFIKNRIGETYV